MPHAEFQIAVDTGPPLFAQAWDPPRAGAGVVGVVHGLGEHSGRYGEFAEQLCAAGSAVVSYDHRGHGRSDSSHRRADYAMLLDDVGRLVQVLDQRGGEGRKFLYGHSLGGNLVLNFVLRRRHGLSAAVASSPMLRPGRHLPAWKLLAARLIAPLVPRVALHNGIRPEDLSSDRVPVERYRRDPLVRRRVTAALAGGMLDAGRWALDHASSLSLPLLLMHGSADPLASADASRQFAARAGPGCTLKIWDNLLHELHWEQQRAEILQFMIRWLRQHADSWS